MDTKPKAQNGKQSANMPGASVPLPASPASCGITVDHLAESLRATYAAPLAEPMPPAIARLLRQLS